MFATMLIEPSLCVEGLIVYLDKDHYHLRVLDSLDPVVDEDSLPVPVRGRLGYDSLPLQVQALLGDILPLLHDHHGKAASR